MSLASLIARRMLGKKTPNQRAKLPPALVENARRAVKAFVPAPPEVEVADPPEAPAAPLKPMTWAGQCKAINADDGRRCGLLKGHDAVDPADEAAVLACSPANRDLKRFELAQSRWHRSARGPFTRCAQPGQAFPDRERLDQLAQARGAPHDEHGKTRTGKELERPKHYRKRAHAGDDTTTGLERPITQESA